VFDDEIMRAYNRVGTPFPLTPPIIFDGEVITKDKDFQKCLSNFRTLKDVDINLFDFHVFDLVCDKPFIDRYKAIARMFPKSESERVFCVQHMLGIMTSEDDILELLEDVSNSGEEGLVLKTMDGPYEYKRSNHWLKLKRFFTEELMVVGLEAGKGKYADVLGKLVCDRDGVEVKVGSGFSDEERREFWENPPEKIEVQYQEITPDKKLRFPVYIRVRDDI
jgi:DNA ligase-1